MIKLIRDLFLVTLCSVFVFMLIVANVLQIFFGVVDATLQATLAANTFYWVSSFVGFALQASLVGGAVLTFALLWRYGRSDNGHSLRADLQNLKMKWDLRGIGRD